MAATAKKAPQPKTKAPATSSSKSDLDSEKSIQVIEQREEDKVKKTSSQMNYAQSCTAMELSL